VPTPTQGYKLKDGTKCPGTTTVIGSCLGWNKEQLLFWANKMGREGKSHRDEAQKAADIGTEAHACVEAEIRGLDIPAVSDRAKQAFDEYREWRKRTQIEIVEAEIALVSESYKFGSTLDAMGTYEGEYELLDWKSSNGCYADHVIQLAAYGRNWMENHPDKPLRRVHLCRFGKEGGFHHHSWKWTDLDPAWEAFLALRKLYDLKSVVSKMV
jgi:hypothetical protein